MILLPDPLLSGIISNAFYDGLNGLTLLGLLSLYTDYNTLEILNIEHKTEILTQGSMIGNIGRLVEELGWM